jgi:Ca2+/Na+ antiporter
MYESTPQHIIDEESTPGPAAGWLDSSSSDDSSSSSSDSDTSGHSRDTMRKRMRRVIRGGRRRKSSVASLDTADSLFAGTTRSPSFSAPAAGANDEMAIPSEEASSRPSFFSRSTTSDLNEEAIDEDDTVSGRRRKRQHKRSLRRYRRNRRMNSHQHDQDRTADDIILETVENIAQAIPGGPVPVANNGNVPIVLFAEPANSPFGKTRDSVANPFGEPRRVDFAISDPNPDGTTTVDEYGTPTGAAADLASARRAFNLRAMSSLRPVAKSLAPTVFTQPVGPQLETSPAGPIPRIRYGIRRTNSLPDRLNQQYQFRPPGAMLPSQIPIGGYRLRSSTMLNGGDDDEHRVVMSRKAAMLLLLVTTGLVAACAEFMVASINGLVATSSVGEVFIGLIILPIVGNAAEHVTAVMVAMKNKMDLAIGVAVGRSIHIALFMTPLVVILGWIIGRDMTLYFTLFETVCLFVSAFIVNFLVLDGRSNYLEGALLCSTYVIISVVAFFYPKPDDASSWG